MLEKSFIHSHFEKLFGQGEALFYTSPGRINLIGEHTDYNNGFVMPGAVDTGIMCEVCANGTDRVRLYSIDMRESVEFSVNEEDGPEQMWARYVFGVVKEMQKRGVEVKGFDSCFAGDVPLGAGMSSSAALESCYAFALNDLFGNNKLSKWDLVLVGQATEHNYCGVNCGIMDQFASVFGQKDSLMCLDCRSREFEYVPFKPEGYRLVLVNSCVKHELVDSPYNRRRESCERVSKVLGVDSLRDANFEMLEKAYAAEKITIEDFNRARFVIGEKERVEMVVEALKNNDYETVGKMMYRTHKGLSEDYEVSCVEIDFLHDIARVCGVTGSRIMGGGFGGCTINLVRNDIYKYFCDTVKKEYFKEYGKHPIIIDVKISDGSRKL